ncbi:MAG: DUF4157 domain-containing protein [Fibrobacter sp.]|nr:M35 family metallo-endopeptidase [Fibrobacter sp.]MBQ7081323.1 DUF4157 domain-containing protein [Fibrobacter sp.]
MITMYAQKQFPAQKKDASSAASVLDSSSQNESLQRKADMANNVAQRAEAPRPNNTGMPDNLKSGIESLSGFSMDDVRVHYNSSKPATVRALAYTQGTDIHVAPGQEKCLPHEAWHVAQQMAGRVSPTTNINGMPVNDNAALEHEADVMGEMAVSQRKEKQGEFVKVNPLNSCSQMFFKHDIYVQGMRIIEEEIADEKNRRDLMKTWTWLKKRKNSLNAIKNNGGEKLKKVIETLKVSKISEDEIKYFKDVMYLMKVALYNHEIQKGYHPESRKHFGKMCEDARNKCLNLKDNVIRLFFGLSVNVDSVKQNFKSIESRLLNIKNNNEFVNSYSGSPRVFAYIKSNELPKTNLNPEGHKHADKIRLCAGYRMARDNGIDSKPGVLIHETSHMALKTEDHEYGISRCKKLAKKNPAKAFENADSYEYAAECS